MSIEDGKNILMLGLIILTVSGALPKIIMGILKGLAKDW